MSINEQKFNTGMDLRRDMFGVGGAEKSYESASDFSRPLQDIVTEFCFGDVWQRGELGRKERSMLTIALLVGSGRMAQLPIHLHGAKANGVSDEELREIMLHCLLYVGIPAAVEATGIAEKIINS